MQQNTWDFVETYYPDYYNSPEILNNNQLCTSIEKHKSVFETVEDLLTSEYISYDVSQLVMDYAASCAMIFEKSIQAFLEQQKKDCTQLL